MDLPAGLLDLLDRPSPCFVATADARRVAADDPDLGGHRRPHVLINTVAGFQKVRNMERDDRVALNVADPDGRPPYYAVRGPGRAITPDGAAEHIERLAQKYLGGPYPWFGGRDQQRLLVTIAPEKVTSPQG